MANDRAMGGLIVAGSVIGIVIYGLLMAYAWQITLRVTAFIAVLAILGVLAWIGYTMATTPPPEPLSEPPVEDAPAKPQ